MRIVFVITRSDAVGGATLHVLDVAQRLGECGHEAIVLVGGEGPVTRELAARGIQYRALKHLVRSIRPTRDLRALLEIRDAVIELRPDLLSVHTSKAGWLGRLAARWIGLPTVFTPHGLSFARGFSRPHRLLFSFAERLVGRLADRTVTVSDAERQLALAHGVASPEQLVTIHNGVRDVPEPLRADPTRNTVRLVTIARCEAPKDHRTLLAAIGRLAATASSPRRPLERSRRTMTLPDWTLDWIGAGRLIDEARELATRLGVADRVSFLGDRRDVAELLARGQIFVLASRSEGFPRSILEAMRAGLPVVASDVGGVRESVVDGVTGFLVPPGDSSTLCDRLEQLIADPAMRSRMGEAGRKRFVERFTFEVMFEKTMEVYETVGRVAIEQG